MATLVVVRLLSGICVVLVLAIASCGSGSRETAQVLTGVIVQVDSRGLGDVRGFTLQRHGRTHEIVVNEDTEADFPIAHLREHLTTAEPVEVEVERRDGKLYALSIKDA